MILPWKPRVLLAGRISWHSARIEADVSCPLISSSAVYRVSKLRTSIGSIVSTLTHKVFKPPEEIYEHRLQGKVLEV